MIVLIKEARKILGKTASGMSDQEIEKLVEDLDFIAVHALKNAREKRLKEDTMATAEFLYDVYQDEKHSLPDNRDEKE